MNKIRVGILGLILALVLAGPSYAGWTEPVPVTELNLSGDEYFPYLSADGSVMVFSAEGTITMSHWQGDHWGPREYLPSPINYIGVQRAVAITPDLQSIYWISWRDGGMGMWDIWRSHWSDSCQCWGPAECLGENINSPSIEWGLCFTADGRRMYFTTDAYEKNGQFSLGFMDIWYSDWDTTTGDWGPPFNVEAPVNYFSDDIVSYVSADGNTLYFDSPGSHGVPGWQGEGDIFKAIWNGHGWGNVENLRTPINSAVWDQNASATPDNQKLYFSNQRDRLPNGDYEIMVSTWDPTSIDERVVNPDKILLNLSLYPNPFNSQNVINANLSDRSTIRINLYDILGRKLEEIYSGNPHDCK